VGAGGMLGKRGTDEWSVAAVYDRRLRETALIERRYSSYGKLTAD
jgi:hypothetical protein